MKKRLPFFSLILLLLTGSIGCGARLPSPRTSERIITKHFKRYGKKHKETDFGMFKVSKVEVEERGEIQRDLAEVYAFVYLSDGGPVYRVRVTTQKKTFGWRYLQWENLGKR